MQPADETSRTRQAPFGPRWRLWPRRRRYRALLVAALALLVSGSAGWLGREQIAANLIDSYLGDKGVVASYRLVEISPQRQVVADLVVGDPASPDFTAERIVIETGLGLLGPAIGEVVIERARLFGTVRDGAFSLGALDPLVFTRSSEPARLPAIRLVLTDARARIDSEFGAVAAKLDGAGRLDDGFAGTLAVTAPGIGKADCRAQRATLFGALTSVRGALAMAGPLRLGGAECGGAALAQADFGTRLQLGPTLDSLDAKFAIAGRELAAGGLAAAKMGGTAKAAFSAQRLLVEHDLKLERVTAPQIGAASVRAAGAWRSGGSGQAGPALRGEWTGRLEADSLALSGESVAALETAQDGVRGTLLAPLLEQFVSAGTRALAGGRFTAEATIRRRGQDITLIVPEARLVSARGETVLAASRLNWGLGKANAGSGNFLLGGAGLPRLNARLDSRAGEGASLRIAMADYAAGDSRLAIPRLAITRDERGAVRFAGLVAASGALPSGTISDLQVPISGRYSDRAGLVVGEECAALRFRRLEIAGLELAAQGLDLCPAQGGAMLSYRDGLRLAVATSRLAFAGQMDGAPLRLGARRAVLRYPGALAVEGLDLRLGEGEGQTRLELANLSGTLGSELGGQFGGGAGALGAVPFAVSDLEGRWRFDEGRLVLDRARFTLADRGAVPARFEPLSAREANLVLSGNEVSAAARLHHPASGQEIAAVTLTHNLGSGAGAAEFAVERLTFSNQLDAEDLSYLAKGVVSFVRGTVRGSGALRWRGEQVTGDGRFATDGLDLAAAFGPVQGLKGEIHFSDLINLTTAPDQRLTIASINTGVEVLDGQIRYALRNGQIIEVADARWPFMGGELVLRPVTLDFSQPSEKRYVFGITALDAATFVAEMELANLSVTGTFDGMVPIRFDSAGNGWVEQATLRARPPGGNVAYVGDLSYEDMGAISNYAFRALRSLDYREMAVVLDGSLTGEIISKFQFDGVRQGEGTSRNFITRRLAQLPILFRVNVRSESFYELATVVRSFFDASLLGNPVDRGLLKVDNGQFVPAVPVPRDSPDTLRNEAPLLRREDNFVQPPESDTLP